MNNIHPPIMANHLGVSIAAGLNVKELSFGYDSNASLLKNFSFSVKKGEITCLLGESGCGKTTLLRIIAGLEKPQKGQIWLDDLLLCDENLHHPPEKRNIGFIFQDYALFPHLSIWQNVAYGLQSFSKTQRYELTMQILNIVGLAKCRDCYPASLSAGEQQRVALARTLITRPALILMDEPFSNLDQQLRCHVREYTIDILKKTHTSSIIVTHDAHEAMTIADRIIFMQKGKIIQVGTPEAIYHQPLTEKVMRFFANVNMCRTPMEPGLIVTPFGCFSHSLQQQDTHVNVLIRQEDLRPVAVDFRPQNGQRIIETRIIERKKLGRQDLLSFYVKGCSQLFSALCNNPYPTCKPGMTYHFMLDPVDVHIFSANEEGIDS